MKYKMAIISILVFVCLIFSGCLDEGNDDGEDKKRTPNEEKDQTTVQTVMLHPGNTSAYYTSKYGNVSNLTYLIVYDDSEYLWVAGDCVNRWRGFIELQNFTNSTLADLISKYNITITNATLIVNYKTDEKYKAYTYVEWSNGSSYKATTIFPTNHTEEVIETFKLFENESYSPAKMAMVKIQYHNPQSGFIAQKFYLDYAWIKIDYEII
jgi:hypothetical protein